MGFSRNECSEETVRSHSSHQGCDEVINEGDTGTHRHWELCQILTYTPATFNRWTQLSEHNTTEVC